MRLAILLAAFLAVASARYVDQRMLVIMNDPMSAIYAINIHGIQPLVFIVEDETKPEHNELPEYKAETEGVDPYVTDEPSMEPYTDEPSMEPYTDEPSMEPYTDEPSMEPYTEGVDPYEKKLEQYKAETEGVAPYVTDEPSMEPYTDEPSMEPYTEGVAPYEKKLEQYKAETEGVAPYVTDEPSMEPYTDEPSMEPYLA